MMALLTIGGAFGLALGLGFLVRGLRLPEPHGGLALGGVLALSIGFDLLLLAAVLQSLGAPR